MTIFPTGLTYSRNTKAPLESNKLFDTLALAQAYVDNKDQTAYVGMTLSVISDGDNNGLYYVERIADESNETGFLKKVGSDLGSFEEDFLAVKVKVDALPNTIVSDVTVNGTSVVSNGIAAIDLSAYAKTSELNTLSEKVGSSEENTGLYKLVSDTAATLRNEMSVLPKFSITVVDSLPTTNPSPTTVYLVKDGNTDGDLYTEYIYVNGAWETLGRQKLDLSAYSTTEEMNAAIATALTSYVKNSDFTAYKSEVTSALNLKANASEVYSKNEANSIFAKVSDIEVGAQVNKIESVKVKTNDSETTLAINDKTVTIDLSPYAKVSDVYSKNEVDNLVEGKLSASATINNKAFAANALVLDSADIQLNKDITRSSDSGTEVVYTTNDNIQGVLASLSNRIDNINAIVDGELNGIASVQAGNGINVTGSETSPVINVAAADASISSTSSGVSVKIANNSSIKVTESGLDLL